MRDETPDGEASTWGKLNAGTPFHIIAVDIDAAIPFLKLNMYQQLVLQRMRRDSWGQAVRYRRKGTQFPDARGVCLNMSEFAREINPSKPESSRRNLVKAKNDLVKMRVLIERKDGLWINKNVDDWPLTDEQKRYARSQIAHWNQNKGCDQVITPPCDQVITPPVINQSHPCDQVITPPLYVEDSRAERLNTELIQRKSDSSSHVSRACARSRPDTIELTSISLVDKIKSITPKYPKPLRQELFAEWIGTHPEFSSDVRAFRFLKSSLELYPIIWVWFACKLASEKRGDGGEIPYAKKCLETWLKKQPVIGHPSEPPRKAMRTELATVATYFMIDCEKAERERKGQAS